MLRIQDIAERCGVSRTTVSNVLHGKTKKVSIETMYKISQVLMEEGYVPNETPYVFAEKASKVIGVVLGFELAHGYAALQDVFVSTFIAKIHESAQQAGYYVMLIDGIEIDNVVNVASRWNVDGLILLGYNDIKYNLLKKKINKYAVLVDAYPDSEYHFVNVGVDDFSGGNQIGEYLLNNGYPNALYIAETESDADYYRWLGFKQAMESEGGFCSKSRYIVVPGEKNSRMKALMKLLPAFLKAGAIAFSSDMDAIEAINLFTDHGIQIPKQLSVTGFDDCMYSTMIRPRLTTVKQDIAGKAELSFSLLLDLISNKSLPKLDYKNPVSLIVRDSVKPNL